MTDTLRANNLALRNCVHDRKGARNESCLRNDRYHSRLLPTIRLAGLTSASNSLRLGLFNILLKTLNPLPVLYFASFKLIEFDCFEFKLQLDSGFLMLVYTQGPLPVAVILLITQSYPLDVFGIEFNFLVFVFVKLRSTDGSVTNCDFLVIYVVEMESELSAVFGIVSLVRVVL